MDKIKLTYYSVLAGLSALGTSITSYLGGWDTALQTLCIFMAIDYLTGIICALIWKKSPKSENGAFESKASIKGLFRKALILVIVFIGVTLDKYSNTNFIRDGIIMFFVANDGLSIVENLGLMGVPLPQFLKNMFEVLKNSADNSAEKE